MEDELIRQLKKPFEKRSEDDLFPIERMVRKIEFFQKYFAEQLDLNFSYYFEHDYATQNTAIINLDSVGDKFYIILQGQVGIYIKSNVMNEEKSASNKLLEKVKQRFRLAVNNNKFKDYQINKIQSQQSDMVLMKILLPGQSFGEMALIHNRPREFTAIALQPSHFAVIRRQYFQDVVRLGQERSSMKEMGFFANLEIFEGWNVNSILQIFKSLKCRQYRMGEVVYGQREEANQIFLIKEGAVDLIQTFQVENDGLEQANVSPLMKQRNRSFSRRIATITKHQFVGLEDLHSEEQRHKYTCVSSSSDTILLIIERELYYKKIYNQTTSQIYIQDHIMMQNKYQDLRHSQLQLAVDSQRQQQQQIIAKINAAQNVEMFQFFQYLPGRLKTLTESSKKVHQSQISNERSQVYSGHDKIIDRSCFTRAKDRSLLGKVQTQSLYQNQAYKRVIKETKQVEKYPPQILSYSRSTQIRYNRMSPQRPVNLPTTLNEEEQIQVQTILQQKLPKQYKRVQRAKSTGNYSQRRVLKFQDGVF